ncbi:unnamed protein product [Nippostrongylus brasiliensis]|uniref:Endo/exonuclease/phosphatase domain-containing protein n=1 Tax=Nippostrongylus brasiliensis TaxID=27835 RepID=A0A0N4Y6U9_NIPBR|nr:unnamed protein product [Nippostrongylus brasiliensis]
MEKHLTSNGMMTQRIYLKATASAGTDANSRGPEERQPREPSKPAGKCKNNDKIRVATLNVGTLTGRSSELAAALEHRSIDLCALQETRCSGNGLLMRRMKAKNGWARRKDLVRVDEVGDRRVHDEFKATDVPRRYLLSADNKSPVVVLTNVGFPALESMTSCATRDFFGSHRLSYHPTTETAEPGVRGTEAGLMLAAEPGVRGGLELAETRKRLLEKEELSSEEVLEAAEAFERVGKNAPHLKEGITEVGVTVVGRRETELRLHNAPDQDICSERDEEIPDERLPPSILASGA